jgi:hypothetical protein
MRALCGYSPSGRSAPDSGRHAGQELIGSYVKADQIEPLEFPVRGKWVVDVCPKPSSRLISDNGNSTLYRSTSIRQCVWYNPTVLQETI